MISSLSLFLLAALCSVFILATRHWHAKYRELMLTQPGAEQAAWDKGFQAGRKRPPLPPIDERERSAYVLGVKHCNESWCAKWDEMIRSLKQGAGSMEPGRKRNPENNFDPLPDSERSPNWPKRKLVLDHDGKVVGMATYPEKTGGAQ